MKNLIIGDIRASAESAKRNTLLFPGETVPSTATRLLGEKISVSPGRPLRES